MLIFTIMLLKKVNNKEESYEMLNFKMLNVVSAIKNKNLQSLRTVKANIYINMKVLLYGVERHGL